MNERIRIRPYTSGSRSQVEIRDVGGRVTYRADSLELAKHVARSTEIPIPTRANAIDLDEYRTWDESGWGDALTFYLSTIDHPYADTGRDYPDRHLATLEEYSAERQLPQEAYPASERIAFPPEPGLVSRPIGETLRSRRTTLVPKRIALRRGELATIMAEATDRLAAFRVPEIAESFRNAMVNFGPSLDTYVVVYDVDGLEPGVYRYDLLNRELLVLTKGDLRESMRAALVGQPAPLSASVTVIYVSEVQRHQWRYRHPRALRGLWIDSAKVVNHLLWSLASRGIVPHMSPAIADTLMCRLLSLEPNLDNEVVYAVSFSGPGKKSGQS